jgi:excisionase family DNA binding protein
VGSPASVDGVHSAQEKGKRRCAVANLRNMSSAQIESATEERRARERSVDRLPSLLTVEEAAALLRVNRKTLYQAILADEIPGVVRLGRVIRLGRDAMLQWISGTGRVSPSSRKPR